MTKIFKQDSIIEIEGGYVVVNERKTTDNDLGLWKICHHKTLQKIDEIHIKVFRPTGLLCTKIVIASIGKRIEGVEYLEELWVYVEGFEQYYAVSNLGRVKSFDRIVNSTNNSKRLKKEIILKPILDKHGYTVVNLMIDGHQYKRKVHRLVAQAFILNPVNLPEINHLDGDKTNNNASNLEWLSTLNNIQHSYKMGLSKNYGESHYKSKLTETQVREIKKNVNNLSPKELTKMYNVGKTTIYYIATGKTWKHLK